jgi:NAD(P)-dependent dehydrogenase (short-subunit alcohol dehydrogenase family)
MSLQIERAAIIGASAASGARLQPRSPKPGCTSTRCRVAARREMGGSPPAPVDIEDEASIAEAASAVSGDGPLDLVIVASGLLHSADIAPERSYRQLSSAGFERYFAVNATGPALVAKHFLPLLRRDRSAVFAALSARVGSIGDNRLGGWYGYRASKAALNMIVRTLALELARTNKQAACIALHPGTVATGMSAPFQQGVPAEKLFSAERAAQQLLAVIANVGPAQSGGIFAWDGSAITP